MDRAVLPSLCLLVEVARRRNFRQTAHALGLSPSTLSHAMSELEDRLDLRLLQRTTRSVSLTEAGRQLLERLEPALQEIANALEDVRAIEKRPSGQLRLTVPRMAAETILVPRAAAFHHAYPDVTLEIVIDDHYLDIVAEGYDAGIRLGEYLDQDMIAVPLGPEQCSVVVATPSYLEKHPAPQTPDELSAP